MSRLGDGYSRAIAVVKVVLPLVALGILSTLFLLSRTVPPGQPIPFSDFEVDDLARQQRLGTPIYTGLTEDGAELRLSARALTPEPDSQGVVNGVDLMAEVRLRGGFSYAVTGVEGTLNDRIDRADLRGGVRITTSDGYEILTPGAWLRTDLSYLESTGPVTAEGPLGRLQAGKLTLRGDADAGENGVAVFTGGVNLLYDPQGARRP